MKARILVGVFIVFCLASISTASASEYYVELNSTEEDYVNFGSMSGFMSGTSWSIIEKVKIPQWADNTNGWHMFRGKAWVDNTGDIAIKLTDDTTTQNVKVWLRRGGWESLTMDDGDEGIDIEKDTWYTICIVYDHPADEYRLYVNGIEVDSDTSIAPMDDSGNNLKLFFGGQDVASRYDKGDLYSEADITIAHQAWFQRALSPTEISGYDGCVPNSQDLFFSTEITSDSIIDASGNGHNGENGNTPHYKRYSPEEEIPEFPTMAIPIAIAMLGAMFFLRRQ